MKLFPNNLNASQSKVKKLTTSRKYLKPHEIKCTTYGVQSKINWHTERQEGITKNKESKQSIEIGEELFFLMQIISIDNVGIGN